MVNIRIPFDMKRPRRITDYRGTRGKFDRNNNLFAVIPIRHFSIRYLNVLCFTGVLNVLVE